MQSFSLHMLSGPCQKALHKLPHGNSSWKVVRDQGRQVCRKQGLGRLKFVTLLFIYIPKDFSPLLAPPRPQLLKGREPLEVQPLQGSCTGETQRQTALVPAAAPGTHLPVSGGAKPPDFPLLYIAHLKDKSLSIEKKKHAGIHWTAGWNMQLTSTIDLPKI